MKWLAALSLLGTLAGCAGSEDATAESAKYVQTWTKAYAETTCVDWRQSMDPNQQFVMAGDMLLRAQRSEVPEAPVPPDSQIRLFADAIDESCAGPAEDLGVKVGEVAATLYTLSDDLGPGE